MSFLTLKPVRDASVSTKAAIFGALAILITQISDAVTTVVGLGLGARELNGLMNAAYTTYGALGIAGIKLIAVPIIIGATWRRRYAPWVIAALYAVVSGMNMNVIMNLL